MILVAGPPLGTRGIPMGMDKSGTQDLSSDVWVTIKGWVVRSGRPETVIQSNGVRPPAADYVCTLKITLNPSDDAVTDLRISRGGSIIGTASSGSTQVTTLTGITSPVTIVDGDVVTAQIKVGSTGELLAGASKTYLLADPA